MVTCVWSGLFLNKVLNFLNQFLEEMTRDYAMKHVTVYHHFIHKIDDKPSKLTSDRLSMQLMKDCHLRWQRKWQLVFQKCEWW